MSGKTVTTTPPAAQKPEEHTKTPWRYRRMTGLPDEEFWVVLEERDKEIGHEIAIVHSENDAAYIVECSNSHAALIKHLETASIASHAEPGSEEAARELATKVTNHFGYEHEGWIKELMPIIKPYLDRAANGSGG